jgi:tetrahydromethanopterin S-methyltransferase subunit A
MTDDNPCTEKHYQEGSWPPLRGDYVVTNPEGRVAVVTLASHLNVRNAAISGTCKTENLGIEKIVANIISNSNIRFLLICGAESKGHLPGNTILAMHSNGIDDKGKIIGSKGAIPFIQNLSPQAIERFQAQVQIIDRIGLKDLEQIEGLVEEYGSKSEPYPHEPFQAVRPRVRPKAPMTVAGMAGDGDVIMGSGIILQSYAWLVRRIGSCTDLSANNP